MENILSLKKEGWVSSDVEVKKDGIMTYLGVIWNMDLYNNKQLEEVKKVISGMGAKIERSNVRMRDKILILNSCLKSTILYRLQHCTWGLNKYKIIDAKVNEIVRKITRNMSGFPGALLNAMKEDGGLGVDSVSDTAQIRKQRSIVKLIGREDLTAIHMQGMISRALRAAGQGGLGRTEMDIKQSLGDEVWATSLIEWLKLMELNIRVCGVDLNGALAAKDNCTLDERIELNRRGIVLEAEGSDGEDEEELPIRIGQCWGLGDGISEIIGFDNDKVEVMEWSRKGKRGGDRLEVKTVGNYSKYPTGMGTRNWIDFQVLRDSTSKLFELGRDSAKGKALTCSISAVRNRKIAPRKTVETEEFGWAKWKGKTFNKIYTDGSWKKEDTVRSLLLNKGKVTAGGGIVLSDGNWFSPIFIEMDVETTGAFPVETISLLTAYEFARAAVNDVEIMPDCTGAISALEGSNAGFSSLLAGWDKDDTGKVTIRKVKAHPERWGKPGEWNIDEKGNWMADHVADGSADITHRLSAKAIIRDIGKRAMIQIVDNEGVPFFGDIKRRNSKYILKRYYKGRDRYRTNTGLPAVWEGTNGTRAHFLIGLNKLRAASIKTWSLSRHNSDGCIACGSTSKGLDHALLRCRNAEVVVARKEWKKDTNSHADKIKNGDVKGIVREIISKAFNNKGGEFACVGTFRPQFVEQLHLGHLMVSPGEDRTIWNALNTLKVAGCYGVTLMAVED